MEYREKLKEWIFLRGVAADHLVFDESCHSVVEAAEAAGVTPGDLVKSICFLDQDGRFIVAVVRGEDRVDRKKVAAVMASRRPRLATAEEILQRSGYPCGGTPPFGFAAEFLVDEKVLDLGTVYAGGGDATTLLRLAPDTLLRANQGRVADIRT